jgi:dipeptidyl aminopeptidase/acylaminoacyl peptidase
MTITALYGSWKSPITSDLIVSRTVGLAEIRSDGEDIYWIEMRPEEEGRQTILRRSPDGLTSEMLPAPWNARTRVHEYGGGGYLIHDGVLYFSNFADQRLYRLAPGGQPEALTPPVDMRYADYVMDARRKRLVAVREEHPAGGGQALNSIVSLALDVSELSHGGTPLVSGRDFYSTPRLSPDGARMCWLEWSHPNMPWDGVELWLAQLASDGSLEQASQVAGGAGESIFQPAWSPDGALYFISDRSGWWNLYRWQDGQVQPLHPMDADFGVPQWLFSLSTYAFESAERLVCSYYLTGRMVLAVLNTRTLDFQPLQLPYTSLDYLNAVPGRALLIGGSPLIPAALVQIDLDSGRTSVLQKSSDLAVDPGYLSVPEEIEFPTEHELTAYAYFYPPHNKDFSGLQGELPPLIVLSHGGPTSSASTTFNLSRQFWTSRGFAVVDVNYGGSTGYGRAYRDRLKGQMGVVDVDDCVNAALYLARSGRVDARRLAIHGGSAGGYITLAALTFRNVFKAGASLYGISDVETLALYTHKFESRYIDSLIGPYPERRDVYVARSPIHFIDQLDCALILFQGSEDKIVLPDQSRKMFAAVRGKGLPVAYLEFPGEGHGFRQAAHIKRALDAELYFYGKVFGFTPADPIPPVEIENL